MSFVSKAQARKLQELEDKGQVGKGTTERMMADTENFDALPDRIKPKQPTRAKTFTPEPPKKDFSWYR